MHISRVRSHSSWLGEVVKKTKNCLIEEEKQAEREVYLVLSEKICKYLVQTITKRDIESEHKELNNESNFLDNLFTQLEGKKEFGLSTTARIGECS